eukprot:GEMP01025647.1.p1 GENE.GEMP01025647.1~~GEMP01025647.1.p1  ORF type:complete len:288 (+),score=55.17 GEMP01025647.1:359-1222(+)
MLEVCTLNADKWEESARPQPSSDLDMPAGMTEFAEPPPSHLFHTQYMNDRTHTHQWDEKYDESSGRRTKNGLADSDVSSTAASMPLEKLFVGGLPVSCGREQLREYFKQFGSIVDCVVMYDFHLQHRGFGFVTFATSKEKEAVLSKYDKHYIDNKWIEVKRCLSKGAVATQTNRASAPGRMMPTPAIQAPRPNMNGVKKEPNSLSQRVDAFANQVKERFDEAHTSQDRLLAKIFNQLGDLQDSQTQLGKKIRRLEFKKRRNSVPPMMHTSLMDTRQAYAAQMHLQQF